jgi:hypothetical protein
VPTHSLTHSPEHRARSAGEVQHCLRSLPARFGGANPAHPPLHFAEQTLQCVGVRCEAVRQISDAVIAALPLLVVWAVVSRLYTDTISKAKGKGRTRKSRAEANRPLSTRSTESNISCGIGVSFVARMRPANTRSLWRASTSCSESA